MDNGNSFLLALMPILSTITYMSREPEFSVGRCIPYILPMLIPLLSTLPNIQFLLRMTSGCRCRRARSLDFTARMSLKDWQEEPDSVIRCFSTVLWEWNRRNETVNCRNLMEQPMTSYHYSENDTNEHKQQPIFVDDSSNAFWHRSRPNILYTMWVERSTDRDNNPRVEIFLKIALCDVNDGPKSVVDHIDMLKSEAKRIQSERVLKQRVLVSTLDKEATQTGPSFMVYEFATTSTFDNFFCEEARLVYADLNHFLHNKANYDRIGRPWTYTVLNEGPPGVGKTKLVKAIAKLTGYTLIIINLAHITNTQTLYEAFHMSIMAGETVPHNKRLYYIPEVDTQLADLKVRTKTGHEKQDKDKDNKDNKKPELLSPEVKPTLGEILNVLDGVPERYGHILVLDTNHLQELDPALIRPGRVDRIVKWQKMSAQSVKQYLENCFGEHIPEHIRWPDRYFSAADLQASVHPYTTWKSFHASLKAKTKDNLNSHG